MRARCHEVARRYQKQRETLRALLQKGRPRPVRTRPLLVWVGRGSLAAPPDHAPDACYAVVRLVNAGQHNVDSTAELRTAVCRGGASPSWRQGMVFPLATAEKGGAVKAGHDLYREVGGDARYVA